jgi:hypothetical protein
VLALYRYPLEGYFVKARRAPLIALSLMLLMGAILPPAWTQSAGLPAVNMGKYVHQPGDNQYSQTTQQTRHGPPPQAFVPAAAAAPAQQSYSWQPTPPPQRPDISLDPIAADEPVPPAGFPPLPDRLDLPVASNWARGGSGGGYGGGGGAYGGASAPGMPGGGNLGPPIPQGVHQHYQHFSPGAFMPPQAQGGGGAAEQQAPAGSHGYYKARTPEYFNANTNGGGAVPGMGGGGPSDAERALRSMGKEPKLSDRNDNSQAPDAPAPVVINQATTQDLSLPEDEFSYRPNNRPGTGSRVLKQAGRRMLAPLNSVGGMTGIHF